VVACERSRKGLNGEEVGQPSRYCSRTEVVVLLDRVVCHTQRDKGLLTGDSDIQYRTTLIEEEEGSGTAEGRILWGQGRHEKMI
jgi:hypothetical protein